MSFKQYYVTGTAIKVSSVKMLLSPTKHIGGKGIPSRTGRYPAPKRSLSWRSGRTPEDVVRKMQLGKKKLMVLL
jgi:hypothetical protein